MAIIPKKNVPGIGTSLTDISSQNPAVAQNSNTGAGVTNTPISVQGAKDRRLAFLDKQNKDTATKYEAYKQRISSNKNLNGGAFNLNSLSTGKDVPTNVVDNSSSVVQGDTEVGKAYSQAAYDQQFIGKKLQDISSGGDTFEDNMRREREAANLQNVIQQKTAIAQAKEKQAGEEIGAIADKSVMDATNQYNQERLNVQVEQDKRELAESSKNFINKQNSQLTSIIQAGGGGAAKDLSVLSQAQGAYMQGVKTLEDMYTTNAENAKMAKLQFETSSQNALNNFLASHSNQAIRAVGMIDALKRSGKLYTAKGIQEAQQVLMSNGIAMSNAVEQYQKSIQSSYEQLKYKSESDFRNKQLAEQARQFNINAQQSQSKLAQDREQFYSQQQQSQRDRLLSEGYIGSDEYTGNIDFRGNTELQNQYRGVAAFKNNNPTGMTWGISDNLKNKFERAGIQFSKGTPRPSNEGGNYISFNTAEDGMKAYKIALTEGGSDDVYSRLKQWVGTSEGDSYATGIMDAVGLKKGDKFSQLDDSKLNQLAYVQMQRESTGYFKELEKAGFTPDMMSSTSPSGFVMKGIEGGEGGKFSGLSQNQIQALSEYNPSSKDSRVSMNMNFRGMSQSDRDALANEYKTYINSPEVSNYMAEALSLVPTTEKDSKEGKASFEKRALAYKNSGLSPEEAKYNMIGANVKYESDKPVMNRALSVMNTWEMTESEKKSFIKSMSDELNKDNPSGVFDKLELSGFKRAKALGKVQSSSEGFGANVNAMLKIKEVQDLLSQPDVIENIGPYAGRLSEFNRNWSPDSKIDKKTAQYIVKLNSLFMALRKEISGTAVTQTEAEANQANLLSSITGMTKNPESIKTTLEVLGSDILKQTNAQRVNQGLPAFTDERHLLDYVNTSKKARGQGLYEMYLGENQND